MSRAMGVPLNKAEAKMLVEDADLDGTGDLNIAEFRNMIYGVEKQPDKVRSAEPEAVTLDGKASLPATASNPPILSK